MTCRDVNVEALVYRYCPEEPAPDTARLRALLFGTFVDELTDQPLGSRLALSTRTGRASVRATHQGPGGLVGRLDAFTAGPGATVDLTVGAARFLSRTFVAAVAALPVDLARVPMHRAGTALRGRVVRDDGSGRVPVPGATIALSGFWRTFPAANVDPLTVREAPNLVALSPGLYAARDAALASAAARAVTLVVAEAKQLRAAASAGTTRLWLSDLVNLTPGTLLALDAGVGDRAEYVPIAAIDAGATPDEPGFVTLRYPLVHTHAERAPALRAVLGALGALNPLARSAIPSDGALHLTALSDLVDGGVVEITGGAATEYQVARRYRAVSDADGYYRLPALGRAAQIELSATCLGLTPPAPLRLSPDYDQAENQRDIFFP